MTRYGDIEALRNDIVKSIYGRRLGMDHDDLLVGPVGVRTNLQGLTSGTSTIPTTGTTTLKTNGLSLVGSTASSGTSAASTAGMQLPAPEPGVRKEFLNISTALITISTVTGGAKILSTGSAGSTYQYISLWGKGASIELIGLTTALWGVLGNPMTTVSTNVSFL
mgnify:CR=1 FL=1|jgi:hypothetical protein|tara:strand:+ start:442 stop:936 length:495 start_codon:yes stop_codon:yes gene_type:complete